MAASQPDKIAVVVIHGMGEQRPMQTLRGFVETAWERDAALFQGLKAPAHHRSSDTWSKPDELSGSAELRRITTGRMRDPKLPGAKGMRADFFELHWADLTADSNWGDFLNWFWRLLRRHPLRDEVPTRLLLLWGLLWLLTLLIVCAAVATTVSKLELLQPGALGGLLQWPGWGWATAALLLFGAGVKGFLTSYFGDVARYVSAAPRNIVVRQAARDRGLKLLDALHRSGEYTRVVVVGHSLGSILAHDLVALAWTQAVGRIDLAQHPALAAAAEAAEHAGLALLQATRQPALPPREPGRHERGAACRAPVLHIDTQFAPALLAWRRAQRALSRQMALLRAQDDGKVRALWLVSDLVTLGSPLSHADFLLADSGCELRAMARAREILHCPPVFESTSGTSGAPARPGWSFAPSHAPQQRRLHHAAAMAPVRWTNLHDVAGAGLFLRGDLISGPLARDFGAGVVDLHVRPRRRGLLGSLVPRLFTHTLYWRDDAAQTDSGPAADHVQALRHALNLLDDEASDAWLVAHAAADAGAPATPQGEARPLPH